MSMDASFCYDHQQDIIWWIILFIPALIESISLVYRCSTLNHFGYLTLFFYVMTLIDISFLYALTLICAVYYICYIIHQTYYFVCYHWRKYYSWIILWLFYVFFLLSVGLVMLVYLISQIVSDKLAWQIALPFQTKWIVWLEYVSLSVFFLPQLFHRFHIKDLIALVGCCFFPWFYSQQSEIMRLHHSFYGLILLALPVRCFQWLGFVVCLDSLMYVWWSERGYWKDDSTLISYDCINVLWENWKLVYTLYLLYACIQIAQK